MQDLSVVPFPYQQNGLSYVVTCCQSSCLWDSDPEHSSCRNVWQQSPKHVCSALLITLHKSIWKHSYCFLMDKSKSGHHTSLCDYSVEDLNNGTVHDPKAPSSPGLVAFSLRLQNPGSHTLFLVFSQTLLFTTLWWIMYRHLGGKSL